MKYIVRFREGMKQEGLGRIRAWDPDMTEDDPDDNPVVAWITTRVSEQTILQTGVVEYVFRLIGPSKVTPGRKFQVRFLNTLRQSLPDGADIPARSFIVTAIQRWISTDTGEITRRAANDYDLHPESECMVDHDPIGDVEYEIAIEGRKLGRHNILQELRPEPFASVIGRYKTFRAALDTLIDMGIINEEQSARALYDYYAVQRKR